MPHVNGYFKCLILTNHVDLFNLAAEMPSCSDYRMDYFNFNIDVEFREELMED
jgi:hypothetical protein